MQTFINGARYGVYKSLAAAVAISALSNANPAVASAATTPDDGSIVLVESGWQALNNSVFRTDGEVDGVSFQLEGVDTTNVTRYPAGEGIGTFRIASDISLMDQVRNVEFSGGEQQFFQFQYVEDESSEQRQKPTFKSARSMLITMDYDPNKAWYADLIELDRLREPVVLRELLPGGDAIYYYGYISFNKVPTKTINENMTVSATFSLLSDPVRYAA